MALSDSHREENLRETARLRLRPSASEDQIEMERLCADPEVMAFISAGRPLVSREVAEITERSLAMWDRYGIGPWAAIEKSSGRWVGRIGLNELPWWPYEEKIEVGFELHKAFWNRGLATEGALAALAAGFDEHSMARIISVTRSDHVASRRVMEKIGLKYQDVVQVSGGTEVAWYALDRHAWPARIQGTEFDRTDPLSPVHGETSDRSEADHGRNN